MAEILSFPFNTATSDVFPKAKPQSNALAPQPEDAAARELALDPQQSFIVEAPAGSGKTGLLMQRFLNLLGSTATAAPEEVLAITFTRKATAELRERIFEQLEAAAADAPLRDPGSPFEQKTRSLAQAALDRDRQNGWNLRTNPRRLRIQTIDSLCMEIAGTLPLLSGSAARTPVDDASELYREAARNTLRQLGGRDRQLHEALHTVLLHRDGSLGDVETLLADMLQTREQWGELVPLDRATLADEVLDQQVRLRLERALEQIVCAGLTRAIQLIPDHALAELALLAHEYAGEPGYNGNVSPVQFCDRPGPPAAEAAHLDHWRALLGLLLTKDYGWRKSFAVNAMGFKFAKPDELRLQQVIADIQCEPLREALEAVRCLPPAKYPNDQWVQAKALFRLLLHALAELKLLFAETGKCDFTEFSLAARSALAGHAEDFAAGSGACLRHLLVDEMQDTSSAQYDLLTALTHTWDGSSQTIFLVGDPKQSIYLFRQARVERFLRSTRDGFLGDVPLYFLQLTANFRSRPAVVDGVNSDFARLFAPPGEPLAPDTVDVPFVAAKPTRGSTPAAGVHWHTRILATETNEGNRNEADGNEERGNEVKANKAGGSQAKGKVAAGSQAGGSQAAGSQAAGSQAAGSQAAGSQAGGSQAAGSQAAGSQAAGSQAAGSQAGGSRGLQPTESALHQSGALAPGLSLAASSSAPLPSPQDQDAAAIRRIVEHWRAKPLPPEREATATSAAKPWRIAVLAHARRHLAPIVAEFNRGDAGLTPIPYRAVKVEPLQDRPEVLDAFALTRALYHPADRAAWFAVLRAPWCGLGAADLLTLAAEGDATRAKSTIPQLVNERAHLLSTAGQAHLQRAWPLLQVALDVNGRKSLSENVHRTWRTLGSDAWLGISERTECGTLFRVAAGCGEPGRVQPAQAQAPLERALCRTG